MTTQRADAIVVAYGSADVLPTCISALQQDSAVDRTIVVNNSPGDRTRCVIEKFDRVTYVESDSNVGFGRAVNRASHLATSNFIAIVNPDAFQSSNTISAAIQFLEERPLAGLVGPRLLKPDGTIARSSKHSMSLIRMIAERLRFPRRLRLTRSPAAHEIAHQTPYVIGSFIVCRRAALDAVKWFDESIFLFGEDQDLCRRLRGEGWQVWYAPIGAVEHLSGHSWRQLDDTGRRAFRDARIRELKAERGSVEANAYRLLCGVSAALATIPAIMRRRVAWPSSLGWRSRRARAARGRM